MLLSAALPLAAYVVFHGFAEMNGVMPLFFAPFGLPGWAGAALYLMALPLGARRLAATDGEIAYAPAFSELD